MSSVREINIKNRTYYLFNDIKIHFDPNNIKIDQTLYRKYSHLLWLSNIK